MKIITTLTGIATDSTATADTKPNGVQNVQSQKGFSRRAREGKNGLYFEAFNGAKQMVAQNFISFADLWALNETHEPKFVRPSPPAPPAKPVPPTPPKTS